MLRNPGFEGITRAGSWTRDTHVGVQYGEVYVPEGWTAWWEEGNYRRPEMKVIPKAEPFLDPARVCDGEWAFQSFTMYGRQHAGLYQVIAGLEPGMCYRFTAQAHAWSVHRGDLDAKPHCSAGVGCGAVYLTEVPVLNSDPQNDAIGNFAFSVGVGSGDSDPFSNAVQWGPVAYIYNVYHEVPAIDFVVPPDGTVTVYLRALSLWKFRTSDAYWDDIKLVRVTSEPEPEPEPDPVPDPKRGQPREQYHRTVLLLFPGADKAWAVAAVDATWNRHRYTIGGSADDSGLGDLDVRRVIAVNPSAWPGDLAAFFEEHYSGVVYVPIEAATPRDLERLLREMDEPSDPPSPPPPPPPPVPDPDPEPARVLRVGFHDEPGGYWLAGRLKGRDIASCCLVHEVVREDVRRLDFSGLANAGVEVLCRLNWGYADGGGTVPPPGLAQVWVAAMRETIEGARGVAGWIIGNEENNPGEWPGGYPHPSDIITPAYYVQLYNAICAGFDSKVSFSPGPLDPYNVVAGEFGVMNDPAAWAAYIYGHIDRCDFVTMHAKTQNSDPAECWSLDTFSHPPLVGRRLHLRTVEDQRSWIPGRFLDRPVYVTEVNPQRRRDGRLGWDSDGAAWVREACAYFRGLAWVTDIMFYRFQIAGEQAPFALEDKPDILTETVRQGLL